jgi:hypothetical protein
VHRLALDIGDLSRAQAIADRVREKLEEIEHESSIRVLPLKSLVALQAFAGLISLQRSAAGCSDDSGRRDHAR